MSFTHNCGHVSPSFDFCSTCDLREQSICGEMNDEEIKAISKTMAHRPVKEGQAILREGEANDHLYVIVSGTYRLVRMLPDGRRQITGFLFKGDYVGMQRTEEAEHSAEALEPGLVCTFSHDYLDEVSRHHPGIKDRLLARGQSVIIKAQDHIVLLGKKTAEEKVISFLHMVAERAGEEEDGVLRIYLPMARLDIADYLGLRLETLSRTLAGLRKSGVIKHLSGRFVDIDPVRLACSDQG